MNLEALFSEVEEVRFSLIINSLSGLRSVLYVLETHETSQNLVLHLENTTKDRRKVLERIFKLLADSDPNFLHAHDAALAAYLYALSKTDTPLTLEAIQKIAPVANLFWTHRLAQQILDSVAHADEPA